MNARVPVEVFPPGEFLREELDSREWSQQELADILGRPPRLISEIISGKRSITPETAKGLGEAFGTGAEYWMNLESLYQLSKVKPADESVARRAVLYSRFPVREMVLRGWIKASENLDVLEQRFCEFFELKSIDMEPSLSHAARKTGEDVPPSMLQLAWLFRVRALAKQQVVGSYSRDNLIAAVSKLSALLSAPEEARHVSRILNDAGVRVVFVEALPGSKIDGACLWLSDDCPVIGMSLRFDRIDNFWFVLRHEIEHVLNGDGKDGGVIDTDVGGAAVSTSKAEILANEAAANFCTPRLQMDDFIARVQPYFSEQRVLLFAQRLGLHPGLVVGQLNRRLGRNDLLKRHQVKIRSSLIPFADVDGWRVSSD
ncbi:HigA family addiction module antitoxin [Hydrogenophaga electricum]|uniref:Transcriptional regulator n=1 Tax=Hydrogenophaga electricum TaxID=1230953 RepID=A0ABQ6CBW7_9BURK|nr:HigA family addiction module antitoxin [Hydrogenophaga electricum]GLS15687.1 transcriptional regulator [Hydrogenophaga electricum]